MTEQIVQPLTQEEQLAALGRYEYGWSDPDAAGAVAQRGINEAVVRDISAKKNEPAWMLDLRLKGLRLFGRKPMPAWGADLHREAGPQLGGPARGHQEHLRPAGHPGGGEAAAGRRCRGAVRVGGRLPQDP